MKPLLAFANFCTPAIVLGVIIGRDFKPRFCLLIIDLIFTSFFFGHVYPFRLKSGQREGYTEGIAVKIRKVRTKERLHGTGTGSVGVVAALCILALMRTQANDIFCRVVIRRGSGKSACVIR